jgi:prepilin-type N-terminal cleavage/methylation domain-containing protein
MGRNAKAFTLVELMVGLMVTSIILSAVATLAFAMSRGSAVGSDYARTQAQIRRATVYLSDLIARCSLICAAPDNDLALWRNDDNGDGRINVRELVYLERGASCGSLRLCAFPSADPAATRTLVDLASSSAKSELASLYEPSYTPLIPVCSEAQFLFLDAAPPATESLAIAFQFQEDGVVRPYEIVASLRGRAAHLLNATGAELVSTDDD